jgi:hypothetical protein
MAVAITLRGEDKATKCHSLPLTVFLFSVVFSSELGTPLKTENPTIVGHSFFCGVDGTSIEPLIQVLEVIRDIYSKKLDYG